MRVLHLVSNCKLTGPVDPAIRLAHALGDLSADSRVAVGRLHPGDGSIDDLVRDRGLEPVRDLLLPKHRRFFANRADVRKLSAMLRAEPVEILHAHLDNAHATAARARGTLGDGRGPLIVRSLYDDTTPPATGRYRWLLGQESDGVIVFSEGIRSGLIERFELAPERVVAMPGAVLTDRFYPRPPGQDLRQRLDIPRDAVVIGIVARIQRHRRFHVLFEAMQRVMAQMPDVYLLVLGRGTHAEEIAHETVKRLGISERTRLPGYIGGDDYPVALASFDVKGFLVPGSDGTCRAVREAMACGVPVIAARRGLLPEIVRDGVDGFIVEDEVEPLAAAILRLARDRDLRRTLGANALRRAREDFCQRKQAEKVLALYQSWLDLGRSSDRTAGLGNKVVR